MKISYTFNTQWRRLIIAPSVIQSKLPKAKTDILKETGSIIFKEADKQVHVITGKTKGSGSMGAPIRDTLTITYEFGGIWEERRGGSHEFLTKATIIGKTLMPRIVNKYIFNILKQSL